MRKTRLRENTSHTENIYDQRNLVFGKQRTSVDALCYWQLWLRSQHRFVYLVYLSTNWLLPIEWNWRTAITNIQIYVFATDIENSIACLDKSKTNTTKTESIAEWRCERTRRIKCNKQSALWRKKKIRQRIRNKTTTKNTSHKIKGIYSKSFPSIERVTYVRISAFRKCWASTMLKCVQT